MEPESQRVENSRLTGKTLERVWQQFLLLDSAFEKTVSGIPTW